MRKLTADTIIRVKASRPPLTGDTRIRLRQIKELCSILDGKARPENSISPDGKKIKKNGEWVPLPNTTEAAKEIDPKIWGTEEQIRAKAKPVRFANSFQKAEEALQEIANKTKIRPLKSADGLRASISNTKIKKLLSGKATDKSFDLKAHLQAAANADYLFRNSVEAVDPQPDTKGNRDIKLFHYTYAPMEWNGRIIPVKFTVREFQDPKEKNKLYSIEAIDFEYFK